MPLGIATRPDHQGRGNPLAPRARYAFDPSILTDPALVLALEGLSVVILWVSGAPALLLPVILKRDPTAHFMDEEIETQFVSFMNTPTWTP